MNLESDRVEKVTRVRRGVSAPRDTALRIALALASGLALFSLAALVTSLVLASERSPATQAEWDRLSSIADFWAGHIGSLGVVFVAIAFVLEMRRHSGEEQARRQEDLRWRYRFTVDQLREAERRVRLTEYSTEDGAPRVSRGSQVVSDLLHRHASDESDRILGVDWVSIERCLSWAEEVVEIESQLVDLSNGEVHRDLDSARHLDGLRRAYEREKADREEMVALLRAVPDQPRSISDLVRHCTSGWRVAWAPLADGRVLAHASYDGIQSRIERRSEGRNVAEALSLLAQQLNRSDEE